MGAVASLAPALVGAAYLAWNVLQAPRPPRPAEIVPGLLLGFVLPYGFFTLWPAGLLWCAGLASRRQLRGHADDGTSRTPAT